MTRERQAKKTARATTTVRPERDSQRVLARLAKREAAEELREGLAPASAAPVDLETPAPLARTANAASAHTSPRRRDWTDDPRGTVEPGANVRVLAGALEGSTGVVAELDGKGGARVVIGQLTARVEVSELVVVVPGRVRPMLSTSHRKPIPSS